MVKIFKKLIIPCLLTACIVLLSSCKNTTTTTKTTTSTNRTTTTTTIKNVEVEEGIALKNNIKAMNLKGYVGTSIDNNIVRWQIDAYHKNKNIIDQIVWANNGVVSLGSVMGPDFFGVDNYYDIKIDSKNDVKALAWTLKSMTSQWGDRDIKYSSDSTAIKDWTGAKELWIKVDASEIPGSESIRVAFEENYSGRESYQLIKNAQVFLVDGNKTSVSVLEGGYVQLPAEFKGYVALPLNNDTFERYFNEGGNGVLDLGRVVQFQISVKGCVEAVDKSFYIEEFAVVGNVNGTDLPINIESEDKYMTVWDFKTLENGGKTDISTLFWYGEFVGKLLTGMVYNYKISPSNELKDAIEEIINDLSKAQGKDGYLGVYIGGGRYSLEEGNWDLWNHYHAIVGLLDWYKQTQNETALDICKKAIECIYQTFKDRSYIVVGGFETNRSIAHAYAQMYQVTNEQKYLDEAERIIMQDCQDANGWYKTALANGHFYQSSSNRWEVLHMIMTLGILYEETGNEEYFTVMSNVWNDICENDIHNSGGFTTNESAHGNPFEEGVIETCCSIAWATFSNEFYKYDKSVKVIDEIEKTYYNAVLGSLLDTDRECTYNSPMNGVYGNSGGYDGRRVSSQQDISFQFNSGSPDMNCCQANFAKGLGQLAEWALLSNGKKLYLNYYGESKIETTILNTNISIKQNTQYPVNGKVVITIQDLVEPIRFELNLRIPSWAHGSTVSLDGVKMKAVEGTYHKIDRVWNNGDTIELSIEESITYLTGERQQEGYTSIYYGPILLALDEYFAPSIQRSDALIVSDIEEAVIENGKKEDCILNVTFTTNGKTVKLVDFASAGKYHGKGVPSTYWTWLVVED